MIELINAFSQMSWSGAFAFTGFWVVLGIVIMIVVQTIVNQK